MAAAAPDRAHAATPPASWGGSRNHVALGDSYASAPGVADQIDAVCQRSSRNYPSLVARLRHARLADVTCAGATTSDLASDYHGRPPQLDALKPGTDVVTLTIGGNDIGFSTVLKTCAQLTSTDPVGAPCRAHYTEGGRDQLAESVAATGTQVANVLDAVRRRSPHAKILLVGYPSLFPDDGTGCTSPEVPFAAGDFLYLRDTTKVLNTMLADRAKQGGATFVDTYTPTIGHDMCRPAGVRWIENLAPSDQAAAAHPTAAGEEAMAEAVTRALAKCPRPTNLAVSVEVMRRR
ncbi:SGNH/GDSL hydrolase family protein [Streptomyces mirabilis]|uniref:SGNH/GDSL hydrolase family protein n=1 Tax=Streptomyces mirabilis TaxID=68239 RepID=UPI0036C627CC